MIKETGTRILAWGSWTITPIDCCSKEISYFLFREMGIPMAEIARKVGVGTTGVTMAIKSMETEKLTE